MQCRCELKSSDVKWSLCAVAFAVLCVLFSAREAAAALPIVAITEIQSQNPNDRRLALLLTERLDGIIQSLSLFSIVNADLLSAQLAKFNCSEETCISRFSRDAGFALVVYGTVERRDKEAYIRINVSSPLPPYWGACFYSYTAKISSLNPKATSREIGYITEEHAARFVAGMLKTYASYTPLVMHDNKLLPDTEHTPPDGTYTVFRISKTVPDSAAVRTFSKPARLILNTPRYAAHTAMSLPTILYL